MPLKTGGSTVLRKSQQYWHGGCVHLLLKGWDIFSISRSFAFLPIPSLFILPYDVCFNTRWSGICFGRTQPPSWWTIPRVRPFLSLVEWSGPIGKKKYSFWGSKWNLICIWERELMAIATSNPKRRRGTIFAAPFIFCFSCNRRDHHSFRTSRTLPILMTILTCGLYFFFGHYKCSCCGSRRWVRYDWLSVSYWYRRLMDDLNSVS